MNERYRYYIEVDGDVLPPEGDDETGEFPALDPSEQDYYMDIIDGRSHHAAPEATSDPLADEIPHEAAPGEESDHQLPLSAYELEQAYRARKLARRAFRGTQEADNERDRPYDELGGRASVEHIKTADELLEAIVTGSKEWMRDVHDMLHYAIPELTAESIKKMTRKDQELLALHAQGLWDRIPTSERIIGWGNKDHEFLVHRYGKGRSMEELTAYLERLENLNDYLEKSEAAWTLRQIAYGGFRSKDRRSAKYSQDRQRYGDIHVVFDKKGRHRVKRLKRQ